MSNEEIAVFWFRRDLRLFDNAAMHHALRSGLKVLPIFIFDTEILDKLEDKKDARVQFIHQELESIKSRLQEFGSDLLVKYGSPSEIWKELFEQNSIGGIYANRDYEPYARSRDEEIGEMAKENGVELNLFKDQVIFECSEVVKDDGDPYTVYSPYSRKWESHFSEDLLKPFQTEPYYDMFLRFKADAIPSLKEMGFESFPFEYPSREVDTTLIKKYGEQRDIPAKQGTSKLSLHLRFGTVSIRSLTALARKHSKSWLNELIWRNFYQVIIWHFPDSAKNAFKPKYDRIPWRDDAEAFEAWCAGKTGYPIVDAGMRQLNETGFMHNRVRMIVASFLTKHLLLDWRLGEAYFAKKLLDFELASNNGGWQWAAGSGCDAAPYFRVFNPELQTKKFDPDHRYIRKWVPEYGTDDYPEPIVDHKEARLRAIETYKAALA